MPSTNGHGPKRAILYARVSTDEQARSGYSLAQQLEALRDYATREGYEVLEEVSDPGQSGASLERPGMDRVRDLVAAGGVSVVLAQDRDRFAREPAYHYILRRDFEEHGTKMRALNDRGDDSPEGELTDGILDQLAKFERAKIAERSRRGKLRKAREGKVMVTMKPPYGFTYNATRDGLVAYPPELAVVERIFRWAAEGAGTRVIQQRLRAEGVPSPRGCENWDRRGIKKLVMSDLYKPHTYKEIAELVSDDVASRLEADKPYGIRWANQKARRTRQVAEPDGNGGRVYRKQYSTLLRPREEWVAIPVCLDSPALVPITRELVEQAQGMMESHQAPQRKHLARPWELRGILRCGCGVLMRTHTVRASRARTDKNYHYYMCPASVDYKRGLCFQKMIRAEPVEAEIWNFVSGLLKNPERILAGMQELIDRERVAGYSDPKEEIEAWSARLEECERLRRAYQDQQAAGLMTLEELRERLGELEDTRKLAWAELDAIAARKERLAELERDRDALIEEMAAMVPDAFDYLSSEDKNRVYRMLRLSVAPSSYGYEVRGAFCSTECSHPRTPHRRSGLQSRAGE